ncbi:PDZK1-interacting protein 1 isoform X2 [Meles meles]|uniref:PDZK1-interacting protein 1 isoform X2 n=1 Tax=Meles meles TaxID=9662 RepID=UPI001E69D57F|nr:PDZK1-interacting protein 1 isoform X2 [Meles meles]
MSTLILLLAVLFTAVPPASCQQGLGNLQPWMQGLIAVAVFLVLVAIAFAVNRFWCQEEPTLAPLVMGGVKTSGKEGSIILQGQGAREHGHDHWKQGRWNPGRNRWKVLLNGGQLQP